jgi:glycine/D-amino acid oxidase-like deaminating enzyme
MGRAPARVNTVKGPANHAIMPYDAITQLPWQNRRMSDRPLDYLIIGQGLAGSALAWHLIHAGQRVCVIDDGHQSASSMVAAGLINPLAGMRFNRRPELDDWLAAATHWYDALAARFTRRFFHALPMLRLFRSTEQRRFYRRRIADPASRRLLGAAFDPAHCPEPVAAPHGGFVQQQTGYVDLPLLLATLRGWLEERGSLLPAQVAPGQIELTGDGVSALGRPARRLVFCDGARLRENPWFGELPLAADKGEILDLRTADWRPRHIINGAHWLVPQVNGTIRFGATHEHHQVDGLPTAAARAALLHGFAALRPGSVVDVQTQLAGVRPATRDHYPLLGVHPAHPQLWVCNGFGARGALTIPWYTACLSARLLEGGALPREADIARHQ